MTITPLYANNAEKPGKPIFNEFKAPYWLGADGVLTAGRIIHCYHDVPQIETDDKTQKPLLDENGIPKAGFKVTLMWPKDVMDTHLIPMRTLAAKTRDDAWGSECGQDQWFRLEPFLRDGDNPAHNTKRKEYLFGHVYLNFKAKAIPIVENGEFTKRYAGAPGLVNVYGEDMQSIDLYAGCYAIVSGIMFGTEYMGKKFISTRLNNIQKVADGERIGGGGRPDAKSQFDPLASRPNALSPMAGAFGNTVL
jgi:Protein of unknown function (DUF2815)